MLITHRVLWADDEDKKETYVQYDVQDGVNLDQAIHDATIDFIIAGAVETELPGDLEYHHFIEYIDSQFCEKYGFTKTLLSDTAEVRDGHALCVSRHEFTHLLAERRAERQEKAKLQEDIKARTDAMREATIKLMVKMDTYCNRNDSCVSYWTMEQKMEQVITWAAEYVDGGNTDINKFFREIGRAHV